MSHSIAVEQSRAIPVALDDAFAKTMAISLPELFNRWYGPIPPIKAIRGQTGQWNSVGETREIVLAGGGGMQEKLTLVDPPRAFGYTIDSLRGPLSPLIDHVEGLWSFGPSGTGTQVTWKWTLYPRSIFTTPLVLGFAQIWRGYAGNALATLSDYLVG
jgi:hypothetical protein